MTWHTNWTTKFWTLGDYTSDKVLDNANEAYAALTAAGWTHEAAIGCISNLCGESTGINAGQWEGNDAGTKYGNKQGFGIGQWTPWTKVSDFVGGTSESRLNNPDAQMQLLITTSGQWSTYYVDPSGYSSYYKANVPYFATFADYSQGTESVEDMAAAYMCCWEMPANGSSLPTRKQYAAYFDSKIGKPTSGYSVSIRTQGNGTASAYPTRAETGTEITLKAEAGEGAEFTGWEVISGGVTITDNKFIMGSSNVVIQASFTGEKPTPDYLTVTFKIEGRGSAVAFPNICSEGDTVNITAYPIGSKFYGWFSSGIKFDNAKSAKTSFTMPDHSVTITARFKKPFPLWMMTRRKYT